MKIVFLSYYSGRVNRGVETFVHALANRLVASGCAVTVFQAGPRLPDSLYNVTTISSGSVGKFSWKAFKILSKDANIVIPLNGRLQGLLTRVWSLIYRKRLVVVGQSGPGIDDRINLYTFPDCFVGLSGFQVRWAKKVNSLVRVERIPNGVDLAKFSPKVKPVNFDLPRPIILSVGALSKNKRHDLSIHAVSKIAKGSLVIVGKGEEQASLQKLGDKLLPGRFSIVNFEHIQMPQVYRAADCFVYPTVPWESFGIVLLEAMASGLPIVTNNDPIRREIVGGAGLFVSPKDSSAFACAIEEALKNKNTIRSRKQAMKFSWEEVGEKYQELFNSLLK